VIFAKRTTDLLARGSVSHGRSRPWYEQGLAFTRHVDLQQVMNYFLQRERRKLDPTYSDVRLQGRFCALDPARQGRRRLRGVGRHCARRRAADADDVHSLRRAA